MQAGRAGAPLTAPAAMKTWHEIEGSGGGSAVAEPALAPSLDALPGLALLPLLTVVAATIGAVAALGPLLGIRASPPTLAVLAVGALAVHLAPERAFEVTALTGLLALATTNRPYALYHAALVGLLFLARNGTWALGGAARPAGDSGSPSTSSPATTTIPPSTTGSTSPAWCWRCS